MSKKKILFILKKRPDFNITKKTPIGLTTGLYNSASFMNDMLIEDGIESELVVVTDNNDIDREVSKRKPTHVIVEALWVVPTKFNVLCKLHPKVNWIVRLHSEVAFLSNEGMSFDWVGDYVRFKNVSVAVNSPKTLIDIRNYIKSAAEFSEKELQKKVIYLPNYYPKEMKSKKFDYSKNHIDIGCFGSIRPLKNHMIQALSAIKFAESIGKKLRFHINVGRYEMNGEPIYNNLISLFMQISERGHQLIKHEWTPREEFIKVCEKMDIGMQVSFSETFNIVSADLVSQGVPVVGSKEIPWMSFLTKTDTTDSNKIFKTLSFIYFFPKITLKVNQFFLKKYINETRQIWRKAFS